jgi:hypothetical protein
LFTKWYFDISQRSNMFNLISQQLIKHMFYVNNMKETLHIPPIS